MYSDSTTVSATLTVRVPLGAAGDLADGARRIVRRVDAIDRLETATVRELSPGLNDTTVVLDVRLAFDDERDVDDAHLRRALERSAGIVAVETVGTEAGTPPPEADVP